MNTAASTPFIRSALARAQRGFTLVELAIVLAVASILLGVATPSMRALIRSVRLTSATNDLFASMLLARNEAALRNTRVALCKSASGTACAAAGGWDQGWIVFVDANNNGVRDAGEPVLQYAQAMASDLRVSGNLNVAKYVSYSPAGTTKLVGGGFQAGTITVCHQSAGATDAREIILSAAGRPRVQKSRVSACA